MVTEHLEGGWLIDRMSLHKDPLGPLRDGPPAEGALELVVLGEPAEDDVDRALPVLDL
jgi:hypothetical protein